MWSEGRDQASFCFPKKKDWESSGNELCWRIDIEIHFLSFSVLDAHKSSATLSYNLQGTVLGNLGCLLGDYFPVSSLHIPSDLGYPPSLQLTSVKSRDKDQNRDSKKPVQWGNVSTNRLCRWNDSAVVDKVICKLPPSNCCASIKNDFSLDEKNSTPERSCL